MINKNEWLVKIDQYTKELEEKLIRIKGTSVLDEQDREIKSAKTDFGLEGKLGILMKGRPNSLVGYISYLNEYKELLKELEDLDSEASKNFNEKKRKEQKEQQDKDYEAKSSHCFYCKKNPPTNHYIYSEKNKELKPRKRNAVPYKKEYLFCSETHFEKWYNKNYYSCDECFEEKWDGKYIYHKSKKDNQKFCSDHCFFTHYAEKCDDCLEKCLTIYKNKATGFAQTYYRDPQDKTGTLCSKCHQEQLKEQAEERKKDKEWEENCKKMDKDRDELIDAMVDEVGRNKDNSEEDNKEENNEKSNQIKSNQIKSNQIKSNQIKSNQIKSNLQHFQSNSIQSVELTPQGDLLITYQSGKSPSTLKPTDITSNPQLQNLKNSMVKNNQKKLTKEELEKQLRELEEQRKKLEGGDKNKEQEPKDSNLGLKIGIGVLVIVVLVSLVTILVRNRKSKKKY